MASDTPGTTPVSSNGAPRRPAQASLVAKQGSEKARRIGQSLLRPRLGTGMAQLLLYSIGQSELQASLDSMSRQIRATS